MTFFVLGSNPRHMSHLIIISFQTPLIWGSSSIFPCFSWPWYFWRVQVRCFVDVPSTWVCLMFAYYWDGIMSGGGGIPQRHPLVASYDAINTWLITGDINLNRLVKVVPAWFLHCNIGILPLPHSGGYYPLLKMKTPSLACDGMGRSAGLLRPRSGFGPGPWYPALLLELWTLTFQGGASIAVILTCSLGDCLAFQFCTEFLLSFTPCPCLSKWHVPECQGRGSNDARWPWP